MANLTVTREIEVRVNKDQLVSVTGLSGIESVDFARDFNIIFDDSRVRVSTIIWDTEGLFEEFDGFKILPMDEVKLEQETIKGTVYLVVKGKKHESIVDEVMSAFKQYVEDALPSFANINYYRLKLSMIRVNRGLNVTKEVKNVVELECTMSDTTKIVAEPTIITRD